MDPADRAELMTLRDTLTAALARVERMLAVPANDDLAVPAANRDQRGLDPDAWYQHYVKRALAADRRPSREQDHEAMLAAGFRHGRDTTRELRATLAPVEWQEPGRPRRAK